MRPFLVPILIFIMIIYAIQTTASPMDKKLSNSNKILNKSVSYRAPSTNKEIKLKFSKSLPSRKPPDFIEDMKIIVCDENDDNKMECENAYYDFKTGKINKSIRSRIYAKSPKNEMYNLAVNMLNKYILIQETDDVGQPVEADLKMISIRTSLGFTAIAYELSLSIRAPQGYFPIALIPAPEDHNDLFIVQLRKFETDDSYRRADTLVLIKDIDWIELRKQKYFEKPNNKDTIIEKESGEPSTMKESEEPAATIEPEKSASTKEPEVPATTKESDKSVPTKSPDKHVSWKEAEESATTAMPSKIETVTKRESKEPLTMKEAAIKRENSVIMEEPEKPVTTKKPDEPATMKEPEEPTTTPKKAEPTTEDI